MNPVFLLITVPDKVHGTICYERQYPSMEQFLADYAVCFDDAFGQGQWSVVLKP